MPVTMTAKASASHPEHAGLVVALLELIDALDRRVPQIERAGEIGIARDALVLRQEAVGRLHELQHGDAGGYDDELVHAIMTDDGG
jgi:hypothetical protein